MPHDARKRSRGHAGRLAALALLAGGTLAACQHPGHPGGSTTTTGGPTGSSSSTTRTTVPRPTTTRTAPGDYWGIEGTTFLGYCGPSLPEHCHTPVAHAGQVVASEPGGPDHSFETRSDGTFRQYLAPRTYQVRADFDPDPAGTLRCPSVTVNVSNSLRPEHVDLTCYVDMP